MRYVVPLLAGLLVLLMGIAILNNFGLDATSAEIDSGSMDLSTINTSEFDVVRLDGMWDFYPDELFGSIVADNGMESALFVPSDWTGQEGMDSFGYGTYAIHVVLPGPGRYALFFDTIYTAYQVYIDGVSVLEVGTVGVDSVSSIPHFADSIVQFDAPSGVVDIAVEVSNFAHPRGGMGVAPILGRPDRILQLVVVDQGASLLLAAGFLFSSLFILFFHHRNNRDVSILWFSLSCFMLALKTIVSNTVLSFWFPQIPFNMVSKLEYVTIVGVVLGFLRYSSVLFPKMVPLWMDRLAMTASILYGIAVIVFPVTIYNPLLPVYTVVFIAVLAWWSLSMVVSVIRRKPEHRLLAVGLLVFLLTVILQNYFYYMDVSNLFINKTAAIGMLFFVIAHYHGYSLRAIEALALSRRTSEDLEQLVKERTKELHEANERLSILASHDDLTALPNRTALQQELAKEAQSYNAIPKGIPHPFTVVYIDLDNFKHFNDVYSHEAGDLVLRLFAKILQQTSRKSDMVFRYGGDEFIAFLRETGEAGAVSFVQRLRSRLEGSKLMFEKALGELLGSSVSIPDSEMLSCSFGLAVHVRGPMDLESLIRKADQALAVAKAGGKNRHHCIMDTSSADGGDGNTIQGV